MSSLPVLTEVSQRCGRSWPIIMKAAEAAAAKRAELRALLETARLRPSDTSIVVFGSLARGEWTAGSDLDWTLLVDGPVVANHADVAKKIKAIFDQQGKKPGPTGVFGGLTFSHDLVHFIGGEDDTNTNITRRILLLLESNSLIGGAVRERVLRALLTRYVGEDLGFHAPDRFLVPRFLLTITSGTGGLWPLTPPRSDEIASRTGRYGISSSDSRGSCSS